MSADSSTWMLFGDLVSLLSNKPHRAYSGWWLIGILTGLTKSAEHPSTGYLESPWLVSMGYFQ